MSKLQIKTVKDLKKLMKAITIGSGGAANPFLPEPLANTFIDIVSEFNNFRKVFRSMKMDNRTRTVPKFLTGTKVYYQPSEATAGVETTFTAGSIQLVAKKLDRKSVV